ncbi:DNA polymerase-3 subunit epsilon [Mumia flava]|uniref:DNA polymerase-3 subunit epsilon n=2 Tax=Mumia flava TaxID=1348852 RepID=A0A2M9BDM1_9ACTN|nr:DNA polymerase-3 subunit epsilon [Mumia flava]
MRIPSVVPMVAAAPPPRSGPAPGRRDPSPGVQLGIDDLGRPLVDITFCVVDLETTGAGADASITEIGAVKVRAGEVLGEFQTLVDPEGAIPRAVTVLTGITDAMVVDAPRIGEALPSFLEFARGCVLVAHNAPFDIGFLVRAAEQLGLARPRFETVDTVRLARSALLRDEVPNCRLHTLAHHFRATTTPNHRALSDARATVDVLHGLLERVGTLGVSTLEELVAFSAKVAGRQRRKAGLADHLPHAPGVYLFRDRTDQVLYVGTSKDLRTRVRTYFTASETRSRMGEMVALAERVEAIVCATPLEAEIRELRLIRALKPPYNRRSRHPERAVWLTLTNEPWPRLSIVRAPAPDAVAIGPFPRRASAERAASALHETFQVRQCTTRLARRARQSPCVLAELGRCLSPCDGSTTQELYAGEVDRLREAMQSDPTEVVESVRARMRTLSSQGRFEDAAAHRDRLALLLRTASRGQRLRAVAACEEIVAARPAERSPGSWDVHVIRSGRLVASGVLPPRTPSAGWVATLRTTAETVTAGTPAAVAAETDLVVRWLESDGVRLVDLHGDWALPIRGAGRHHTLVAEVEHARAEAVPADERRAGGWRTQHQPPR